MIVPTVFPHGGAFATDAPPIDPDHTLSKIPLLTLNGQIKWCYHLVTPVFEGAGDDGTVGLVPRCCHHRQRRSQRSRPRCIKNPLPSCNGQTD